MSIIEYRGFLIDPKGRDYEWIEYDGAPDSFSRNWHGEVRPGSVETCKTEVDELHLQNPEIVFARHIKGGKR